MVALRAYPAIKCLYAAGITAIAGERWGSLRRLFDIRFETHGQETEFLRSEFFTDRSYAKQIRPDQTYIVPLSEHLYEALKTPLVDSALDPHQFDRAFARFEYFAALQFATLEPERAWAPPGRFAYKVGRRGGGWPDYETIGQELTREGDAWTPLTAGLFGGTVATAEAARSQIVESLKYMPW